MALAADGVPLLIEKPIASTLEEGFPVPALVLVKGSELAAPSSWRSPNAWR